MKILRKYKKKNQERLKTIKNENEKTNEETNQEEGENGITKKKLKRRRELKGKQKKYKTENKRKTRNTTSTKKRILSDKTEGKTAKRKDKKMLKNISKYMK